LVDGKRCNFDGADTLRCCSRSGFIWEPWFAIELEQEFNVKQVNLKTFTEEAYRLKGAEIRVGNSPNAAENELCTIIDKPKENVLQTFRCLSDELTGKFVSVHVPNKYEDIILCELEVYQIETDELQDDSSSSSSSSSIFSGTFPLNPWGSESSDPFYFDTSKSEDSNSFSDSFSDSNSKLKEDEDSEEDSGDGWFDDEELLSMQSGFLKRS